MKVSVIIPTRNEGKAIGRVLKEIPKNIVDEIIVIDGYSTDNTASEARSELRIGKDKFILQKKKGFGNALLEAFRESSGDVIIILNGDGSQNPKDIPLLLEKINQGHDYVIASRYAKGGRSDDDTTIRFIGNRTLTWLTNLIHRTNVSDSLYFFTAIRRSGLNKIHPKSSGFEFCIEILIMAHKAGLKFAEVPVVERPSLSKTKVNAFWVGLKILEKILQKY